jgi:hypothetical protein
MTGQIPTKINLLLKQWPEGTVATNKWLESQGVYRQLAEQYVRSGWLERIARGAFVRSGSTVDWLGAVYALQRQLGLNVHVAGETALLLRGLGHYLPLGTDYQVSLFGEPRLRLPKWFTQHDWGVRVTYRCPDLFADRSDVGFEDIKRGAFAVKVAAPERAIMEVMHLATTNHALDHAVELHKGLTTLRPDVVQDLLEACSSVKVKRLFLWASEQCDHSWLRRVDTSRVRLGSGKRALYKGGKLNGKYGITVPADEELPYV